MPKRLNSIMPATRTQLCYRQHLWSASSSLKNPLLRVLAPSHQKRPLRISPHTNDRLLQLVPRGRVITQPVTCPAARRGERGAGNDNSSLSRHLLHGSGWRGTRKWLEADQGRKGHRASPPRVSEPKAWQQNVSCIIGGNMEICAITKSPLTDPTRWRW